MTSPARVGMSMLDEVPVAFGIKPPWPMLSEDEIRRQITAGCARSKLREIAGELADKERTAAGK